MYKADRNGRHSAWFYRLYITKMTIDIHLPDDGVRKGMRGLRFVRGFVRVEGIRKVFVNAPAYRFGQVNNIIEHRLQV